MFINFRKLRNFFYSLIREILVHSAKKKKFSAFSQKRNYGPLYKKFQNFLYAPKVEILVDFIILVILSKNIYMYFCLTKIEISKKYLHSPKIRNF